MVAPIDAKVVMTVEGEDITLRLNMRSLGLAEKRGIDMLDDDALAKLTTLGYGHLFHCLASEEQPAFTIESATAVTVRHGKAFFDAYKQLVELAAGKGGNEGNAPKPV